jgi:hypothetical protein
MSSGNFFAEVKRRRVIRMAALDPRYQALLELPATAEKDATHE